jgi:hypothetical protein
MNRYRVERGPVSPPASEHGHVQHLATGELLHSHETPWIRRCLRDGRLALDTPAPAADAPASPEPESESESSPRARSRSKRGTSS